MRKEEKFVVSKELAEQIDNAMNKSKELEEIISGIKDKLYTEQTEYSLRKVVRDNIIMPDTKLCDNPTFITMFALLKAFSNLNSSVKKSIKDFDEEGKR